jgi:hypothetical protein
MTIHLFILQALVSAAMYTKVKAGGGPEDQRISYDNLHDQTHFLSQLFRTEFIFPTEGLDVNLANTLTTLERDNIIKVTRSETDPDRVLTVGLSDTERESGRENFDFYCFLVWPFIEAAWLGAISLLMLTPPNSVRAKHPAAAPRVDLKKFQDRAQLLGKTLYHQGDLSYFEAVNKETLKNAFTRFEDEGMIIVDKPKDSAGKSGPTIRLANDWMPEREESGDGVVRAEGRLWRFAEKISLSRREGKNRRDGATVRTRVLRLVDLVGAELWEEADVGTTPLEENRVENGKDRKRNALAAARL